MPAVHVKNNRKDLDGPLCLAFNDVVSNKKNGDAIIRELLAEMSGLGLSPAKANPGQSIVIFVYCKTGLNVAIFIKLFNSGRLQFILEGIFNQLLLAIEPHNTEKLVSRIRLEDEDVAALEGYLDFTGNQLNISKRQLGLLACNAKFLNDKNLFNLLYIKSQTAELIR